MKNKKKKFSSMKSILALLQQLQVKYYKEGPISIDVDTARDLTIIVYVRKGDDSKWFPFGVQSYLPPHEDTYKELLDFINTNPL